MCDQARCETLNSISPYGANLALLIALGNALGIPQGLSANGSVNVVFSTSSPTAGYVIPVGFVVSDGTNYYTIQDGGITETSGSTQPLTAIAQNSGTFAIPANTVNQITTSVPSGLGFTLSVNNPLAGTPATGVEAPDTYRSRVLQATQVACQGTPAMLKTLLGAIPGVVPQQIAVRSVSGGWEVICGGGDAYAIAGAIYQAAPNLSEIVGSTMLVTAVTQANPGVFTTDLNHGLTNGETAEISGADPSTYDVSGTVTVVSENQFSLGVNTTSFGAYVGSGIVSPNPRNITVDISDYPDTYSITFVQPPLQTVNVQFTWNTDAPNFVAGASVAALGVPAIVNYINSIPVGAPINLFEMQAAFQQAVASILPTPLLTRMVATVSINSIPTNPSSGTGLIAGDPESYFSATSATVTVTQG